MSHVFHIVDVLIDQLLFDSRSVLFKLIAYVKSSVLVWGLVFIIIGFSVGVLKRIIHS